MDRGDGTADPGAGAMNGATRVVGLDHVVLTVSDLTASRAFYGALPGCEVREFGPGRWGAWVGDQKINFHEAGRELLPAAARPTVGGADLCLLVDGPLGGMMEALAASGVEILEGPVIKSGANGPIRSIYFRDPDGNLLEMGEPVDAADPEVRRGHGSVGPKTPFRNTYEDARRAAAYDELELGGTYDLAFRNLPRILSEHTRGSRALDFGCGTGRSTRFLRALGYDVVGVDISDAMVARARRRDPAGDYRVLGEGDFSSLPPGGFDLVLSAFTFDNVPGYARKVRLFSGLGRLLDEGGVLVNVVSTPEIYLHEWVTFSTRDYPENREARCGDVVRVVTTEHSDARPVEDILWPHEEYLRVYRDAGLDVAREQRPLAVGDEGVAWKSETTVPPWAVYVLRPDPHTFARWGR